ncbi:hypothetical protein B0T10DRAFT_466933 [Thelonectria olida]|uniref:Flavin-containing monooxygenase n=1 Tax=Thelonectria olida TaxID=1576542 RepID=A0A9P9AII6_9HYPO|nr:hypothetical protein B0T10DRAFT_466933 [Thelonectria olida]
MSKIGRGNISCLRAQERHYPPSLIIVTQIPRCANVPSAESPLGNGYLEQFLGLPHYIERPVWRVLIGTAANTLSSNFGVIYKLLKYLCREHEGCSNRKGALQPVDARLFEYQPQVGGTVAARSYEDAELVSSKQLTTFSDFRHHSNVDFLSTEQYVEYLHDYCTRLNLWPCISLNTRVLSVTRGAGGGHIVSYQANDSQTRYEWKCDAIAVCSGLHVAPNTPDIRGIQSVPQILHSSELKSRNQFGVDKTVMVVGSEGTGSDTVYLAVTSTTKRVLLCHNDGVHFAPKVGFTLRLTLLSSVA